MTVASGKARTADGVLIEVRVFAELDCEALTSIVQAMLARAHDVCAELARERTCAHARAVLRHVIGDGGRVAESARVCLDCGAELAP